jgi:hypothetical protein
MLTKQKVLASIKELSSRFSVDDLIDRIILLQKVETGLEQSKKGNVKSSEEAKKQMKLPAASSGVSF